MPKPQTSLVFVTRYFATSLPYWNREPLILSFPAFWFRSLSDYRWRRFVLNGFSADWTNLDVLVHSRSWCKETPFDNRYRPLKSKGNYKNPTQRKRIRVARDFLVSENTKEDQVCSNQIYRQLIASDPFIPTEKNAANWYFFELTTTKNPNREQPVKERQRKRRPKL